MAKGQIRRVKSVGLTDIPEQTNGKEGVKLQDKYEMFSIPDNSNGEFIQLRQIGGFVATRTHWVTLEGKEGKMFSVPKTCLAFDPEIMAVNDDTRCPYCEAEQWFKDHEIKVKAGKGEGNPARAALEYITNAIIREIQEDITPKITKEEERESGIIEKGSKSKTPVRVVRFTPGVITKIKDVEKLNVHKVKLKGEDAPSRRAMPVGHDKYGIDLNIKFNPKAKAASDYYAVQRGDASPLEEEEKQYLRWDIEAWPFENEAETEAEAEKEIARLKGKHWDRFRKHNGVEDESDDYEDDDDIDEDDEDEDEDDRPSKKSKSKSKSKAKGKSKSKYDDDEDDDDDLDLDDDEDDEDEDDEPPKKKGKSASKSSSKKSSKYDDDEDEDDDLDDDEDDEDDEDEDDEPPKKSKKPAPKSKGKSRKDEDEDEDDDLDDDEDEDDDLDDDEDEDDEPKSKKSKKPAPKSKGKKSRDEDDEDEDDDLDDDEDDDLDDDEDDDLDDDEDEDDEPPKKSKSKKPAPKSKGKSRKDEDDEDEDEDDDLDDLDDDEDEDDEPPVKKSKSKKRR